MIKYGLDIPELGISLCNIATANKKRCNMYIIDRDESAMGQISMLKIGLLNSGSDLSGLIGSKATFLIDDIAFSGVIAEVIITTTNYYAIEIQSREK